MDLQELKVPAQELKNALKYIDKDVPDEQDRSKYMLAVVLSLYLEQKKTLSSIRRNVLMIAIPFIITYVLLAIGFAIYLAGASGL